MQGGGLPSDIALWKDVSDTTMKAIGRVIVPRRYQAGEAVYNPESGGGKVYFVLAGRVSVFRMLDGGRKMIIDVLGPNDIFGDIHSLFSGNRERTGAGRSYSQTAASDGNFVEAISDSLIGVARKDELYDMLAHNPEMGIRVIESLGRRLKITEAKVREMALQNVSDRIVTELVRMYERYGASRQGEWLLLDHKFTHEGLGNLIGVSREAVTRNLAALQRRGLVKHGRGFFRIHNSLIRGVDKYS